MTMTHEITRPCLVIGMILLSLMAVPVTAGYTQITQGGTVFIGEEGLDVTAAMGGDSAIGWWGPGDAIATTSPRAQVVVDSLTSFDITPMMFSSNTGTWYRLNAQGKADGQAFTVTDPYLNLRVLDTTVSVDVTNNKWVYRGDQVSLRIETNMNPIFSRAPGGASDGITIKVQAPDGGTYSALIDSSGTAHPIENLAVTSSSYETGPIWDTGNSLYPSGRYSIWAECNVNRMKDNYEVTGKTVSSQISMLDQEQNPSISVSVPTTSIPTTTITKTVTTQKTTTTKTVITTIPATTHITTSPTVPATTLPVQTVATSVPPVETTPTKSAGFGTVLALVSVCVLVAVIVLKKQ